MSKKSISHVIFDFDGTICNTMEYLTKALEKSCSLHGFKVPDHIKLAEFGSFAQLEICLIQTFESLGETIYKDFRKEFTNFGKDCFELLPGVQNLIHNLHKLRIPMAVATGGTKEHFTLVTEKFGDFFKPGVFFEHLIFAPDDVEVKHMKPHPDLLQVCGSRFKIGPKHTSEILVFDDSIVGMKAAKEANMTGVWVVDQRFHRVSEQDKKYAHLIINSINQFDTKEFGLDFSS